MLIVSYDISDDKLRTKFSNFLSKFGYRLQYSVFQLKQSPNTLKNIVIEIEGEFKQKFSQSDSVIVFDLSQQCKVYKYGYARNDDEELIIIC
jgi:CRISPR-associated protein Cas2